MAHNILQDQLEDWTHGKDSNSWVSESIWGHRFKAGQSINVLLNEFLTVAEAMHRAECLLSLTTPNDNPELAARKSRQLRCILFYNPYLEQICNKGLTSEDSWDLWFEKMGDNRKDGHPTISFSYLKERFKSSHAFKDFAARVNLLRRITIDPGTNRKWSNQLLFPVGPEALYIPTNDKFERDRTLFTRTGEVAYLMLSRADDHHRDALKEYFEKLFDQDSQKNRLLLGLVKDKDDFSKKDALRTFFPYKSHPSCNRLAEDILSIFQLNLPNQDSLAIIKHLIAFNLYLYILETANCWCGNSSIPPIVCEILSPKMDLVRRVSGSSKRENEDLCKKAVEKFIHHTMDSNRDLSEHLSADETGEDTKALAVKEFLEGDPLKFKDAPSGDNVKEILQDAIKKAKSHCSAGVQKAAEDLGRICGLSSKRRTNRYRYAPSDELLNALILANVKERTEEAVVLLQLHDRYGLVIAKEQAEQALDADRYDANQFEKNSDRFRQRLVALGLAERLSDACTYISNHHVAESHPA